MAARTEDYRAFFESLKSDLQLSKAVREDWIGYLYHVTDIHNAVAILRSGNLLSRAKASAEGRMDHDNADPGVIGGTDSEVSQCARLYFRPRTPTFYRNEGFRSKTLWERTGFRAHCPVPVALVFDAATVLALPQTRFSNSNLAARTGQTLNERTFQGLESLKSLPFEGIYHADTLYRDDPRKPEIIRQRNAEVIVPNVLPLEGHLRAVRCRSDAELATLRTLLGFPTWARYRSQAGINTDAKLFFAEWFFIERVRTANGALILHVHQPIDADERMQVFEATITVEYEERDPEVVSFKLGANQGPVLKSATDFFLKNEPTALISIHLNDQLAYKALHWLEEEPMLFPPDRNS